MNEADDLSSSFYYSQNNNIANYLLTDIVSQYPDLRKKSIKMQISDLAQSTTSIYKILDAKDKIYKRNKKGFWRKLCTFKFTLVNPIEWSFIIGFTCLAFIYLAFLDNIFSLGFDLRIDLANIYENNSSIFMSIIRYISWVLTSIFLLLLATSIGHFITPDADGSGIPEMKTILSGVPMFRYFSFDAFIGTSVGLFGAVTGGASVGKVGPYVHLTCLICTELMKVSYFKKINNSVSLKNLMLSCGCAVGITFALGCPLGGLLFSIETTAAIYLVSTLWKAFFSCVLCFLLYKFYYGSVKGNIEDTSDIMDANYFFKLFNFILVGAISGAIGGMCSKLIAMLNKYRKKRTDLPWLNNRFRYVTIVAIVSSTVTFIARDLANFDKKIIFDLFTSDKEQEIIIFKHKKDEIYLLLCCICKFFITIISLSANIPSGVFGPMFTVGALFGRLYGCIIRRLFGLKLERGFSMAASAGAFSGFSHTISSALMIFEIAGQPSYLPIMLLTCVTANLVAQTIGIGIFDVLLYAKNLPYLPAIKSNKAYKMVAEDFYKKTDKLLIIGESRIIDALILLNKIQKELSNINIPILDIKGIIRYTITPQALYNYCKYLFDIYEENYEKDLQISFKLIFHHIERAVYSETVGFSTRIKHKCRKLWNHLFNKSMYHNVVNNSQNMIMNSLISQIKREVQKDEYYLSKVIDFKNTEIELSKSALFIEKDFPAMDLQFLFTFLGMPYIFVTDSGKFIGIINRNYFIEKMGHKN